MSRPMDTHNDGIIEAIVSFLGLAFLAFLGWLGRTVAWAHKVDQRLDRIEERDREDVIRDDKRDQMLQAAKATARKDQRDA